MFKKAGGDCNSHPHVRDIKEEKDEGCNIYCNSMVLRLAMAGMRKPPRKQLIYQHV